MSFVTAKDNLIQAWIQSQRDLAVAKEKEADLRAKVVALDAENAVESGTVNLELGNGYKLKYVYKQNTRFISSDAVQSVLDKIERTGDAGALIANRLVKWKPELSITEYKQLPDNFKKMIDEVVIFSAGTPSVEFVEPKAKK